MIIFSWKKCMNEILQSILPTSCWLVLNCFLQSLAINWGIVGQKDRLSASKIKTQIWLHSETDPIFLCNQDFNLSHLHWKQLCYLLWYVTPIFKYSEFCESSKPIFCKCPDKSLTPALKVIQLSTENVRLTLFSQLLQMQKYCKWSVWQGMEKN